MRKFTLKFSVEKRADLWYILPMENIQLPTYGTMLTAFQNRDPSFDGVFFTGVRTTGIFCRPTCSAKKPLEKNIEFFVSAQAALFAGYRACRRCHPMEPADSPPDWVRPLLEKIDAEPEKRWRDRDLRTLGLHPDRVRRWFKGHHNMTFQAYSRARRLGTALGQIQLGTAVIEAAYDSGFESVSGFNSAFRKTLGDAPSKMDGVLTLTMNRISTPLGQMIACASEENLLLLEFVDRRMLERQIDRIQKYTGGAIVPGQNHVLEHTSRELTAYFEGKLNSFSIPFETSGTPFQEIVWAELLQIPFGETVSYADLAIAIEKPSAVRAVANANGHNRLAILIPCHRVIGKDGTLTGYGGGLWRKRRLLDLESNQLSLGPGF